MSKKTHRTEIQIAVEENDVHVEQRTPTLAAWFRGLFEILPPLSIFIHAFIH